ncbi:GNAT family N-acetyltransferase [Lederbergia wuyishanensis]|uniref:Acetyltransferase n=1 Tax=Lederbergia wuyishanensis TaxID=1347903 RepID=A0ABU0D9W9_9BACI|nr:GNAT family N-acetyltransferase [Lederbergia wuyishanensis]MCJ8008483.1 GNAT family N-acetyltransferase [Lederbergia wuyishanensis]MDQ0345226.1 putative acetyltransferase [Lederbergia wuyishanensis]
MSQIKLVEPSMKYRESYLDMIAEWHEANENVVPFVLKMETDNFEKMVQELKGFSQGMGIPETFVPHTTYWLMNEHENIIGVINIRHYLNERLIHIGGHIGYGVRPSERKKGYATMMLRLALEKAKDMDMKEVLITCDKENIGSAKTIISNGGQLESEVETEDGRIAQRFWIRFD